jgi:DnaK suppressor protein
VEPIERSETEARIRIERAEVARLVGALTIELDEIVDSVSLSNNDDEHDPDGATNGYERAKATAMLRHAEERLIELDRAAERLQAGTYGRCERCGGPIGNERLDALVAATRCLPCAAEAPAG